MAPSLTIALAIPTYNRDQVLVDTLEQVLRQRQDLHEVLVIDQSESHDAGTSAYLAQKSQAGMIRHILHQPPNLPGARNRALAECTSDVIIFIDDDVTLSADFVARHRDNYRDEGVVAVAGRVEQPGGWHLRRGVTSWRRELDYRHFDLNGTERVARIAHFAGGNHSIRVSAARGLGGYDQVFTGTGLREETDMALRLFRAGGTIVFDPRAFLKHLAVGSGGCRKRSVWDNSAGRSLLYFAVKHARTLKKDVLYDLWLALKVMVISRENARNPFLLLYNAVMYLVTLSVMVWNIPRSSR